MRTKKKAPDQYKPRSADRLTPIKLHKGAKVRVHCPRPDLWPSFARGFQGRAGTVLQVEPHEARGVIQVDVSTKSEPGAWINVERTWLRHNDGRARA